MIRAIGIDVLEIERFAHWHHYTPHHLSRIFTPFEIDYCLSIHHLSAERFAARFALKEAAFKAWTQATGIAPLPFLTWCQEVEFQDYRLHIKRLADEHWIAHCSVSHSKNIVSALVIIEEKT